MRILAILLLSMLTFQTSAQQTGQMQLLYGSDEIPGSQKSVAEVTEEDIPKLYVHRVAEEKKEEVFLVIPGGGYAGVAIGHEGHDVAERLNQLGYSAYVLFYRLPKDETMKDKRFGPLQDAQYAMSRIRAAHPGKEVVVIGFSAGGHLAASLSNHYDLPQTDELKATNLRPDVSVLCYPVISMHDAITHAGSKKNLIGADPDDADVTLFSMELQVDENNQPTFLMSAKDDRSVPIENTYQYQNALKQQEIPHTVFTYEEGGHGFGLVNATDDRDWFAAMMKWLQEL